MHTVLLQDQRAIQERIDLVMLIQATLDFKIRWPAKATDGRLIKFSFKHPHALEA